MPFQLAPLVLCVLSCSQAERDPSLERWRAHYAAVERELRASEPRGLSEAARAARARSIDALAAYRERGEFGRQDDVPGALVPRFVDGGGRRCAIAELLHRDGRDELVERVRRTANGAWVGELAGDAELRDWLAASGLTLEEAARIQTPAGYDSHADTSTDPGMPPRDPRDREPGPRPYAGPLPPAEPSAPTAPPAAPVDRHASDDGWWTWWEYNKLDYLLPRGLEQRLARRAGVGAVAEWTEPLRSARLPRLLEGVRDPDSVVRAAAALSLGRLGRAGAVAPLTALLADPSARVRAHALLGLGASGSSEGARILLRLLEESVLAGSGREPIVAREAPLAILALAVGRREGMDPSIARSVARLAPRVEPQGPGALVAACQFQRLAPDPALEALALELAASREVPEAARAAALEALSSSSDPLALARLQDALFGRSLELRRSAALALGASPQVAATGILLTASELEAEPLARGFVLLALGARGGTAARDALVTALRGGPLADEPWAALALGVHARGTPDATISAALLDGLSTARNEDSRPALLLALGLAREPLAAPRARAALFGARSPRERGYAATALALLGGAECRAWLRERLAAEPSGFVRANLAQGLAALGEDADVPSVFLALRRLGDPGLQAVTAASIGQMGSVAALAGLDELADAPGSALVRATALGALGVLLERGEPLVLPDASRASNYALYEDWTRALFLVAL